jgi:hypothetical protein
MNKFSVFENWNEVKKLQKEGKKEELRDTLDTMLGIIILFREKHPDAVEMEGAKIDLWFERIWVTLENEDLMLDETNCKNPVNFSLW